MKTTILCGALLLALNTNIIFCISDEERELYKGSYAMDHIDSNGQPDFMGASCGPYYLSDCMDDKTRGSLVEALKEDNWKYILYKFLEENSTKDLEFWIACAHLWKDINTGKIAGFEKNDAYTALKTTAREGLYPLDSDGVMAWYFLPDIKKIL